MNTHRILVEQCQRDEAEQAHIRRVLGSGGCSQDCQQGRRCTCVLPLAIEESLKAPPRPAVTSADRAIWRWQWVTGAVALMAFVAAAYQIFGG